MCAGVVRLVLCLHSESHFEMLYLPVLLSAERPGSRRFGQVIVPVSGPLRFLLLRPLGSGDHREHQIQIGGLDAMLMFGAIASAPLHLQEQVERTPDHLIFAVLVAVQPDKLPTHITFQPAPNRGTGHATFGR